MNRDKPIYVTRPSLPDFDRYSESLRQIWESGQLTNNAPFHQRFEKELTQYLGVPNCSLLSNGTLALIIALQALRITGEVITTPFSFVATTHALRWNGIEPVFCDIDPKTGNIDPSCIESLITPATTAILPVHVYGQPCDMDEIERIADVYGLKVIYDAAHAFAVQKDGVSILNRGDLSVLSFHATKTFNTVEGGAIVTRDPGLKQRVDFLRNFGFVDELTVTSPGINAKMNDLLAAYGLLQLETIDSEIEKRKAKFELYRSLLEGVDGIRTIPIFENIRYNYTYYPIFIDSSRFGKSREDIYHLLKEHDIHPRRYFYPLISDFPFYRKIPSASPKNLMIASMLARQVLCLPLYADIEDDIIREIVDFILSK